MLWLFFFFKQKTAYEMRISDWSSDVCSPIYLRGGADEHTHGEHRAFLDDHALDHFRPRADEAAVLDDHRPRLQRLQHTADAGAAGEMHVLADLVAGADSGPGVDNGAAVDAGPEVPDGRNQDDTGPDRGGLANATVGKGATRHPATEV